MLAHEAKGPPGQTAGGNLTQRWHNGKEGHLTHYEDHRLKVDYTYDAIELLDQPEYGDYYRKDEDPLWLPPPAPAIDSLAWYQCDHLGTPQELTDKHGEIAWSAEYRAWGVAQKAIRKASGKALIANPIRFQRAVP